MSILVGQLIQDQKLIYASPTQQVSEVFKTMIDNDFSQMPVINESGIPVGILTSDSIARALMHFGAKIEELRVRDAMIKVSTSNTCKADEELIDILDIFLTAPAILITATDGKLIGLITEYDTTKYFRQRAEDIVIVSDIENALKQHLLTAYDSLEKESESLKIDISNLSNSWEGIRQRGMKSLKSLQSLCSNDKGSNKNKPKEENKGEAKDDKAITQKQLEGIIDKYFPVSGEQKSFYDLTLSEFIQLANKAWPKLTDTFEIDSSLWTRMMEEVRLTRNKLAHFRGDTTAIERRQLRFCSDWFKLHPTPPKSVADTDITTELMDEVIKAESDEQQQKKPENTIVKEVPQQSSNPPAAKVFFDTSALTHLAGFSNNPRIDTDSKYKPLVDSLNVSSRNTVNRVAFRFTQIEMLIKQSLPRGAREHTTWWTNSSTTQASVWIAGGWRASEVDLSTERVVFSRWLPVDRKTRKVSLANPWEVIYWTGRFDRTERDVAEAIRVAGSSPTKVGVHLAANQAKPLQNEGNTEM